MTSTPIQKVDLSIEIKREDDGRWIAEIVEIPGAMTYGSTKVQALALRVLAERLEYGEVGPELINLSFQAACTGGLALVPEGFWRLCCVRQSGSHRTLSKEGWPDYTFAFHDHQEIGPRMLARVAKHTGLRPEDLQLT